MDTDLDLDGTIDVSALGPDAIAPLDRVIDDAHRIGIVQDGEVVAVLIDPDDAKNLERLEAQAEEEWVDRTLEAEPEDMAQVPLDDALSRSD
jgi:hypothetical protein